MSTVGPPRDQFGERNLFVLALLGLVGTERKLRQLVEQYLLAPAAPDDAARARDLAPTPRAVYAVLGALSSGKAISNLAIRWSGETVPERLALSETPRRGPGPSGSLLR